MVGRKPLPFSANETLLAWEISCSLCGSLWMALEREHAGHWLHLHQNGQEDPRQALPGLLDPAALAEGDIQLGEKRQTRGPKPLT